MTQSAAVVLTASAREAKDQLDAHVRQIVEWHFNPETGCPFWLEFASKLGWDPRQAVHSFEDLRKFPPFQDEWLRGGPVRRWLPRGMEGMPLYVFETGGTTGVPKSRLASQDFRIDYEMFSDTLPDKYFPRHANWLMLGPSGPRRLRLAVEHLCQHRGGICFSVDLDPRLDQSHLPGREFTLQDCTIVNCDYGFVVLISDMDRGPMVTPVVQKINGYNDTVKG